MSEYHAAVALASLDDWPHIRRQHARLADCYRMLIQKLDGVSLQPGYGTGWVSNTTNVILPPDSIAVVSQHLLRAGIQTRRWWGQGCHVQPAFQNCPSASLSITEDLGSRVLGLPHFPDMWEEEITEVVNALSAALLRNNK